VIASRAAAIRALARAVPTDNLRAIPGIGAWTAQYIAMRALNEPDAFPSGDLVLRRMAGNVSARALEARSESWRPWRAYAVMLLWQSAVVTGDHRAQTNAPARRRSVDRGNNVATASAR
jgi:AraC family transcriptional regulator of adaptative response / DNA-3-methyladenine glycosylase II